MRDRERKRKETLIRPGFEPGHHYLDIEKDSGGLMVKTLAQEPGGPGGLGSNPGRVKQKDFKILW